jgi:hypothetical protein
MLLGPRPSLRSRLVGTLSLVAGRTAAARPSRGAANIAARKETRMIRKLLLLAATVAAVALLGVSEASADYYVIVQPTVPTAKPDLVVSSVTPTTVTVKNVPDAAYSITATAGPFVVRVTSLTLYCSYGPCEWVQNPTQLFYVPSLAAAATATLTMPSSVTANYVYLEVDPWQQVAERDETNNTYLGWTR